MSGPPDSPPSVDPAPDDRLDSWKEIAAYLKRDVTTAQRWERREDMPVHRHVHDKVGSVYAFRTELDAWVKRRGAAEAASAVAELAREPEASRETGPGDPAVPTRRFSVWWPVAFGAVLLAAVVIWQLAQNREGSANPLTGARFQQLTDFGGTAQAAALSRDGRFVAFLSDRDGAMDVWVTQIGTGQHYNLTRGAVSELVNPSIRTLGFSPDGTLVTFWTRRSSASNEPNISVWAAPVLGGQARPYLEGAAELDWSSDGTRLVYHTPGPGDPMFVRNRDAEARQIFSAAPGLHGHFPVWSPDQSFIYFVQGRIPDRMDVWRIRPAGGDPERVTNHDSRVSHPVFVDARTLLYLVTESDGSGPSIYRVDVQRPTPQRVSVGVDRYTSLATSSDGRRIVATISRPTGALWRFPMNETGVDSASARRISLTTGNGFAPRLGHDFLVYAASKGESDSLWKLQQDLATELWNVPETRITGAPAISRDGSRIAFVTQRNRQTALYVVNEDGTNARVLTSALQVQGGPAWAPDGRSVTVGAVVDGMSRLFSVPLDGNAPTLLVNEHSVDPVWSSDGSLLLYSGPDIGTTFPVKAVVKGASADLTPKLMLSRGSRHLLLPGKRSLLVLRGEISHKDLWLVDLETGAERQLTRFAPGFNVRDFDMSPDGREIVVEQVQEHSDVVLIDVPSGNP
jgi:Tol biopolymer transport system component